MTKHSTVKTLDKASGTLFMLGLVSGKLRFIPIPLFSSVIALISLGSYLAGYLIWLFTCRFYPQYPAIPQTWFGFLPIRQQHLLAAITGVVAMGLCFAALALPILAVAGTWIFALSNLFWVIAEYHRLKNPPTPLINPYYVHRRQVYYLSYAILATLVSILAGLLFTAPLLLPALPAITAAAALTSFISTILCFSAFYFLFKSLLYAPPHATAPPPPTHTDVTQPTSSYTPILDHTTDSVITPRIRATDDNHAKTTATLTSEKSSADAVNHPHSIVLSGNRERAAPLIPMTPHPF